MLFLIKLALAIVLMFIKEKMIILINLLPSKLLILKNKINYIDNLLMVKLIYWKKLKMPRLSIFSNYKEFLKLKIIFILLQNSAREKILLKYLERKNISSTIHFI